MAVASVLLVSACVTGGDGDASPGTVRTSVPPAAATVLGDADAATLALSASAAVFEEAPLVVIAPAGDPEAQLLAAAASVPLGVPLLLASPADSSPTADTSSTPAPTSAAGKIDGELERLGTARVLLVGDTGFVSHGDVEVTAVAVEATADAVGSATGLMLDDSVTGAGGSGADDSDTDSDSPVAVVAALPTRAVPYPDAGAGPAPMGPPPARAAALGSALALVDDDPRSLAAAATIRAARAGIQVVSDPPPDLLDDPVMIDRLHDADPDAATVLLVGPGFAAQPAPDWSVRVARTDAQLPGGGLRLFGSHRFVALYGTPGAAVLGVLGEQDVAGTIARAQQVAAQYDPLSDIPVIPTLEIIATVAAGDAGADGDYSNERDVATLEPYVAAAEAAGMSVVLDLQPGRTDFLTQAKLYRSLLEHPNVGLALDPEWRLGPGQVPLEQIGSVSAAEVNAVAEWLAQLVNTDSLPPKMLVLHQFRSSMIGDRASLDLTHPELEYLLHVDGQGAQPDKQNTWNALHEGAPPGVAWGWKNFYDEDAPMLTPEQTMTTVAPVPDFISYQ
ncbi:hypothetical protein [Herbiconiux sp. UC225_62]|uniref:hypothetical protein n=1 Tax=Herbiconiux sp. UC225_62 TaxID=3350168 RepID=UPI0036D2865E